MRIGRTLPPAASPIYLRDIINGIKGVFRGKEELERFKSEIKEYFGMKHCFLFSSGKAALTLILKALHKIYPGRDEVLIPAFSCYSVPSAIVRAGLKVRLCDIHPDTLDFDFEQLAMSLQRSADGLLAIIPTHLFGFPADVARIRNLIDDLKITIVEDAAQAMGAEWNGKKLGTLGDVNFFSLGRGKALSAVEGGIILTDRDDIAEKIRSQLALIPDYSIFALMRLFFMTISLTLFLHPRLFWLPKSFPFLKLGETIYDPNFNIRKMSAFQAGLANSWQEKVKKFKKIRSTNSRHLVSCLQPSSTYYLLPISYQLNNLIRFPIRIDDEGLRMKVLRRSYQMGLGIMPTYPDSINGIPEIKDVFQGQRFPMAKEVSHNLITLPIHSFVAQKDEEQIAAMISQITHYRL